MMEPFVSIIVPVYKVPEQYLRKCIERVRNVNGFSSSFWFITEILQLRIQS